MGFGRGEVRTYYLSVVANGKGIRFSFEAAKVASPGHHGDAQRNA
jgi:hypothetical protein